MISTTKRQIFLISFFFLFFSTQIIFVAAATETIDVGTDPLDDMKSFKESDFEDVTGEFDIDEASLTEFEAFIKDEVWSKGTSIQKPNYIDMELIKIVISGSTAEFKIIVEDKKTDLETKEILVLIWSDCTAGDGCEWQILGIIGKFVSEGYSEDINSYYGQGCDDTNCSGAIDCSDGEMSIEFPSDWLGDEQDCHIFVMLITPLDDDYKELAIDVFPNDVVGDYLVGSQLYDLLLYIIAGCVVLCVCLYARYESLKPK